MRTAGRIALALAATLLVLLASAGLSTIQGEDDCSLIYEGPVPKGSEGFLGSQEWSLWPPGVLCGVDLPPSLGGDPELTGGNPAAFLGFVALAALVALLVLRQGPTVDAGSRAAAAALAGLVPLGLGAWGGTALAAGMLALIAAPVMGYAVDRYLRRNEPDANRVFSGIAGAVIATFAVGACSFLWLAGLDGAAGVVTLAAFTVVALIQQVLAGGVRSAPA